MESDGVKKRHEGTKARRHAGGARRLRWWGACLLLLCGAAGPMPAEKRLPARIVGAIAAPADQPMHMPTDVAIDSKGRIYVADGANDRILRFTADGKLDETISAPGQQKLKRPLGIDVDGSDRLWIADTGNNRLLVVDEEGKLTTGISPLVVDEQGPARPTDVAVSADGKRAYVVDNGGHRILVRDNQTRKWTALGKPGRALGQFQWPFMICTGAQGYVYVSEAIGARVQRISPSDKWAGEIGQWGVELGQFYRPKGLAADAGGRLFVGDSTQGAIQVFGPRGLNEGVLTDKDGLPLKFAHPMGMCFDKNGRLLVVELAGNRVAIVALAPGGRK